MSTESNQPDPQTVRDFARRAILSSAEDVDCCGIGEQFGDEEAWPNEEDAYGAMLDAVYAEQQKATVTVSWPDEQHDGAADRLRQLVGFDVSVTRLSLGADRVRDLEAVLDQRAALAARVAELAGKQPVDDSAQEPIGGWILWDPEGRWMHTTTWTLDANRNDDGWKAVSINEAEGREFQSKGCILDELDQAGWRAFDELRGTTNAAGSRELWLARCAALNADMDGGDR